MYMKFSKVSAIVNSYSQLYTYQSRQYKVMGSFLPTQEADL